MANEQHLETLDGGVGAWNRWYGPRTGLIADFRGAQLACKNLVGLNLTGADLRDADLRYSDLRRADFRGADLTGAKLVRAILYQANLQETRGLTQEQLHHAEGDESTKLPRGMRRPAHWKLSGDRQSPIAEPSAAH